MLRRLWRGLVGRAAPSPQAVSAAEWAEAFARVPVLAHWPADDRARLRTLATQFLAEKTIEPVHGLLVEPTRRLSLALQAALPVLNLGLDWYRSWHAVVLYPDEFRSRFEEIDEAGVVHEIEDWRGGESWAAGPLILSLADVEAGGQGDGYNVVIHECAHKLDQLDGDANGCPPLHAGMDRAAWREAFSGAFRDLGRRSRRRLHTVLDPYAAESPGEFFAVASEAFFDDAPRLARGYPGVYQQLCAFYRQDPARLWPAP